MSKPRAQALKRSLRPQLLAWFARSKRDLPWRRTQKPYEVWVSEVMLQQTQVDRVIGYWTTFLTRFPTVSVLASAELKDVLGLWAGLGYYSRARNLHLAAQEVVSRFDGALPSDIDALLSLPGFGRYTAGAVGSIAFNLKAPLIDGNVARVFSRLFEIEGSPGEKNREAELWACAEVLVDGPRPGDWNQALMELGATICIPKSPRCHLCPVKPLCGAIKNGRVHELPPPKKQTQRQRLELAVAVARKGTAVLFARRPEKGLFGGLWELPSAELSEVHTSTQALETMLGSGARVGAQLALVERTLTHRDLVLRLHQVKVPHRLQAPPASYLEWRWVESADIETLGMSSAMKKALSAVTEVTSATTPGTQLALLSRQP